MTTPRFDVRHGDVILRKQPPVVGYYCMPPTSTKARLEGCCHGSVVCAPGPVTTCGDCGFHFCASHYPRHRKRFECPVDIWKRFNQRRLAWYSRVKKNPQAQPKVDVHFPEDAA